MATVKIVCADAAVGTLDDLPVLAGTKNLGFEEDVRGGGLLPVVQAAQRSKQSFQTTVNPVSGMTLTKLWALFRTLDNVTLSAGTTDGDADFTAAGPCVVEAGNDAVLIATITVG